MRTRFYYTLEEINVIFGGQPGGVMQQGMFAFLNKVLGRSDTDTVYTNELFKNYIWNRFYQHDVVYIDVEHDPWTEPVKPAAKSEVAAAIQGKMNMIYSWLYGSEKRYSTLITNYEEQKNRLMDKLTSKATTLFNDTPQDGGDVTADGYITNATTATTTSDVATPIARLKEIQNNLENLYEEWSKEFRKFVLF